MDNPEDLSKPGTQASRDLSAPARRPWHAPQFMLTEIALTDNQALATTDPATTGGLS